MPFLRSKRRLGGAKSAMVPVPVRSGRAWPVEMMREMRSRYWYSSACQLISSTGVKQLGRCREEEAGEVDSP